MEDEPMMQREEPVIDFNSMIARAENSERAYKFTISANHYYTLLTTLKDSVPADRLEDIKQSFIYNTFLFPSSLNKDKLVNFLLNSNLNFNSSILNIFKKLADKKIIYDDEATTLFKSAPKKIQDLIAADTSMVEKSVFEHNIFSISLCFENISFPTLSNFLKKNNDLIKSLLFRMIIEGKIKGKIDENENYFYFPKEETQTFDSQVKNFCSKVVYFNDCITNQVK